MKLGKIFNLIGVGGGLAVVFVALMHLWPIMTPQKPYNTMLHILTSYTLLPLGLTISARDAHRAGIISSPHQFLGSQFDPVFEFLSSDTRFLIGLMWTGWICLSFNGIYSILGFLLLQLRVLTLIPFVVKQIENLIEKLEERGIKVPGLKD